MARPDRPHSDDYVKVCTASAGALVYLDRIDLAHGTSGISTADTRRGRTLVASGPFLKVVGRRSRPIRPMCVSLNEVGSFRP